MDFGIDTCARPIAEPIADYLGQVPHELIVVLEVIWLDAHHRAVVGDPDQEVAALCVEKRRDRLKCRVGDQEGFANNPAPFGDPRDSRRSAAVISRGLRSR